MDVGAPELVYGAASLVAFAVGAMVRVIRRRRANRRWQVHPITAIANATEGEVLLVGTVQEGTDSLTAPLSGRSCVAYQLTIHGAGGDDAFSVVLATETRLAPFTLVDSTGRVLVRSDGDSGSLEIDDAPSEVRRAGGTTDPTEPTSAQLLAKYQRKASFFEQFELREAILRHDDTAAIFGRARRVLDLDPKNVAEYREVPTRLELAGDRARPLLLTTDTTKIARAR